MTINMVSACGGTSSGLTTVVYRDSYDPSNFTANVLQQSGDAITNGSYGVTVPANTNFFVVVHPLDTGASNLCAAYTLTVGGPCTLTTPTATPSPLVSFTPS